jgi:DNA-binding XRE family transcriptional regulator
MEPHSLRSRRTSKGLTQEQLAAKLGVSTNTVARWERGVVPVQHPERIEAALRDGGKWEYQCIVVDSFGPPAPFPVIVPAQPGGTATVPGAQCYPALASLLTGLELDGWEPQMIDFQEHTILIRRPRSGVSATSGLHGGAE